MDAGSACGPLAPLPAAVAAEIYSELLAPRDLASLAQACKAWRPLPLAALARLQVTPRCSFPFEKLAACAALRHISVQTNRCAAWRGALDALMRARAPALRRLAVEFWGGEDPGMLDDLAAAMQVQGPACCLSLAVTDREALAALAARPPLPGLDHLDANLAYLHEGAADQIAAVIAAHQAAAAGHSAGSSGACHGGGDGSAGRGDESSSSGAAAQPRDPAAAGAPPGAPGLPPPPLSVGVWVCCWGGCPGLRLPAALELRARLGRRLVGLESVNCTAWGDVAELAAAAEGLTSLGFNLEGFRSEVDPGSSGGGRAGGGGDGASGGEAVAAAGPRPLPFLAVAAAARGLRRLTLHGSSPAGWDIGAAGGSTTGECTTATGSSSCAAGGCSALSALSALSGLTTLSLARDWGPRPLPLPPLVSHAALADSLLELTLKRRVAAAPGELEVIGRLRRLRSLALTLDAEPQELARAAIVGPSRRSSDDHGGRQGASAPAPRLTRRLFAAGGSRALRECVGAGYDERSGGSGDDGGAEAVLGVQLGRLRVSDGASDPPLPSGAQPSGTLQPPCGPQPRGGLRPANADLSWLRRLSKLRSATLAVPFLDFDWLPEGLEELDCLKFSDSGATWLRCSCGAVGSGADGSGDGGEAGLHNQRVLPLLARLALPGLGDDSCSDDSEEEREDKEEVAENAGDRLAAGSSNGSNCGGAFEASEEDGLITSIALRCPALEELSLACWQPAPAVAAAAAAALPRLRRLELAAAGGAPRDALEAAVAKAAPGAALEVVDPPVPLYPWSSVSLR